MSRPRARNLILSGGIQHDFPPAARALANCLNAADIQSTISEDLDSTWAGIASGSWDLVTLHALRWRMTQHEKYAPHRDRWAYEIPQVGRAALWSHVQRGGGLLGLHTAALCFDTWDQWGELLGVSWRWGESFHPELGVIHVAPTSTAHPVTEGIAAFDTVDEVYHALNVHTAAPTLLTSMDQPLFWAYAHAPTHGLGRVVYDALGHDADAIEQPTHATLLRRSAAWLLQRSDDEVRALR